MADNNLDRPSFDIYGMLLLLSVLTTGGASYILYTDLNDNWKYNQREEKIALSLTQPNEDPLASPDIIKVRKVDLDEWKLIKGKDATFPIPGFEWPEGYDPLKYPVQPDQNNLDNEKIPEEQRQKLLSGAPAESAPAAPVAPAAPTETKPAEEPAPTTPAAPTETPKTEPAPAGEAK